MLMREEKEEVPGNLITVACHEDLTGSDLVGRYLIQGDETVWIDGPLTQAVRLGTVCYLDEIVEARKDTIVLIHPLTDHRRILPIDKKGEIQQAHSDFLLVISYNPGYQSILKDLKHSTRQRFVTIEFTYPPRDKEAEVIAHESTLELETALEPRPAGREGPPPQGQRSGRGGEHATAHLRRTPDGPGGLGPAGVFGGGVALADR